MSTASYPTQASPSQHLSVPAQRLALHTVLLPHTPVHRLQAALAGVLEEQLLDDPTDLHFALASNASALMKAGQAFDVLVCDKAWLRSYCAKYVEQGGTWQTIVPDDPILEAAGWDLAQFDFAPRSRWLQRGQKSLTMLWRDPQWRSARIAVVLLLVVQIGGLNLWAWRDRQTQQVKRTQIENILRDSFPQTKVVMDAPLQMNRAVVALRTESASLSDKDLERLLANLSRKNASTQLLEQVDYASGELKVLP